MWMELLVYLPVICLYGLPWYLVLSQWRSHTSKQVVVADVKMTRRSNGHAPDAERHIVSH